MAYPDTAGELIYEAIRNPIRDADDLLARLTAETAALGQVATALQIVAAGGSGSTVDLSMVALKTDLAAKLDAAYATFADDAAALAGIPAGRYGVAKKGGRLSLYANDGGTLVDLLAPTTF